MNKAKKLLISTMLVSMSMSFLNGIVFSQDRIVNCTTEIEQSVSPRYKFVISSDIRLNVSSSEAKYKLYIQGSNEVTKISGTLTLYKNGEYVTSKRVSANSDTLDTSGTLTASGRGSYELIFSGTVSTRNGSEPITISETDSY